MQKDTEITPSSLRYTRVSIYQTREQELHDLLKLLSSTQERAVSPLHRSQQGLQPAHTANTTTASLTVLGPAGMQVPFFICPYGAVSWICVNYFRGMCHICLTPRRCFLDYFQPPYLPGLSYID